MNYDQELMSRAFDALAIYNYTRLPRTEFTEAECDMFAESVERIVNREKKTSITVTDQIKPTYIQCAWEKAAKAGPENYKKVMARGQGWRGKELGEAMLKTYVCMPEGKEKEAFTKNLAISEAVLLDAMDNFELILEGVSGNIESIPNHTRQQSEEDIKAMRERIEAANKIKKEKMKKRIKKAAIGAAVVGGAAAVAYGVSKKNQKNETDSLLDKFKFNSGVLDGKSLVEYDRSGWEHRLSIDDIEKIKRIHESGHKEERALYKTCLNKVKNISGKKISMSEKEKEVNDVIRDYKAGVKQILYKNKKEISDFVAKEKKAVKK